MLKKIIRKTRRFLAREDGPTTVEYSVMLGVIVLGLITAIKIIGTESAASFNATANGLFDVVGSD